MTSRLQELVTYTEACFGHVGPMMEVAAELRRLSAIEAECDALRAEVDRLRTAPAPVAQGDVVRPYGACSITGPKDGVAFILRHLPDVDDDPAPVVWRDHVEQRMRQWRQRAMNRSGDRLALDDFMDANSLEDLIDYVCDEWAAPAPVAKVDFGYSADPMNAERAIFFLRRFESEENLLGPNERAAVEFAISSIGMRFPDPVEQFDKEKLALKSWGKAGWDLAHEEQMRRLELQARVDSRVPLSSSKDRPGATFVEGYGYVDSAAVRAIERHHGIF